MTAVRLFLDTSLEREWTRRQREQISAHWNLTGEPIVCDSPASGDYTLVTRPESYEIALATSSKLCFTIVKVATASLFLTPAIVDLQRVLIATTPSTTLFMKRLVAMDDVRITTGSTYDNAGRPSADFLKKMRELVAQVPS